MSDFHIPVMIHEVLRILEPGSGKKFIDATAGGGGHTIELAKTGTNILAIDTDPDAIKYITGRTKESGLYNIILTQGNFRELGRIAVSNGFTKVDGVLFDLGMSSHQLDHSNRGFSYRYDNVLLDMRFNPFLGIPAWQRINQLSMEELYEAFSSYGEEKHSRAIAHAITVARSIEPIKTVGELRTVIDKAVGGKAQDAQLARIFQAIRILINDELTSLRYGLQNSAEILKSGGKLAVISYHSREDRIVKMEMKRTNVWKMITKKPILASREEVLANKRARSAKLRISEKL